MDYALSQPLDTVDFLCQIYYIGGNAYFKTAGTIVCNTFNNVRYNNY